MRMYFIQPVLLTEFGIKFWIFADYLDEKLYIIYMYTCQLYVLIDVINMQYYITFSCTNSDLTLYTL